MKRTVCLLATIIIALIATSCSNSGDSPPTDEAKTISHPSSTGDGGTGAVAAPAPTPAPASTTPYAGEVVKTVTKGSVKFDGIKSKFKCKTDGECTATKYSNAPKDASECTCQATCTPFVVNKEEARKRKESNERLCGPRQWFGPKCPAPDCSFIEFEAFKCVDDVCGGWAEGR
ncbi:MAG: hypothetical protein HN337_07010 [Deltaproteobacteria bacterium]|jgi:hypothetical protein|nr:hypothetical protein [Deltaproteobacteria bacterium]